MAKPYRLMKVREGDYNIRDRNTDAVTGTVRNTDGKWAVSILGHSASLVSKDKAVGFVRGVYAANNGSNSSQVSSELRDEVIELVESASVLLSDIQEFKQRLGA